MNPVPAPALPPRLLAGYAPLPGVADELVDPQGQLRPVWRVFLDQLSQLPPEEVAGFEAGTENSPAALQTLILLYAALPSVLKAIAIALLALTPLKES